MYTANIRPVPKPQGRACIYARPYICHIMAAFAVRHGSSRALQKRGCRIHLL